MTAPEGYSRTVVLRTAEEIPDDVPTWAWEYEGRGRIAVGTLVVFAGRPGAGKSTSARWICAQLTRGTLPGSFHGTPVSVAYIAREESLTYVVKPAFRANGSDLARVLFPEVVITDDNQSDRLAPITTADVPGLSDKLKAAGVRAVVVDPLMSMVGARSDVNRNNEVRAALEPWRQLAEDLDGVVLGVAHLTKATTGDVVAGINGSSAFGEVARAVFGFAKDHDSDSDERIMSQEKNSLGDESLALRYRIGANVVTTDSGRSAEVATFEILGASDKRVGDVLRDAGRADRNDESAETERDIAREWLRRYLADHGEPVDSADAKKDGRAAGFAERTIQRARADLGVVITPAGRKSTWSLPVPLPVPHTEAGTGGTGGTDQIGAGQGMYRRPVPLVPPVPRATCSDPVAPIGGLTPDTPGQTDRVRQALATAQQQPKCRLCRFTMTAADDLAAGHHLSCVEETA